MRGGGEGRLGKLSLWINTARLELGLNDPVARIGQIDGHHIADERDGRLRNSGGSAVEQLRPALLHDGDDRRP